MDPDLDTLATAIYVSTDDLLKARPELVPWRPAVGMKPKVSDAEMITLAVLSAVLGFDDEARWVGHVRAQWRHVFPCLPHQPGYNKRLRRLGPVMVALLEHLAADTSVALDDVLVVDSTPVECARSRETVKRSDLAGWAEYGYCASHSRYFWGLRLHLVCTLQGLPTAYALTGAKADERTVLTDLIGSTPALAGGGRTIIADKNYYGREFESTLAATGFTLLRKARTGKNPRLGPTCSNRSDKPWNPCSTPSRATQPQTTRWPHPDRCHRPRPATTPGHDRRHLAQRPHGPNRAAVPDRLRPLTPWN
ncbi:IS982 family transposase [Humibacillus xanthopallidus]|uniref:IS982 family transposase n=1 Tax=Humibacillus xanthopallidus TaxID=412689 RepID=UPI00384DD9B9